MWWRRRIVIALLASGLWLATWSVDARQQPRPFVVRLTTGISTLTAVAGVAVDVIAVTSPLDRSPVVPLGCRLRGTVVKVERSDGKLRRSSLHLQFDAVENARGVLYPARFAVVGVDNARETVDADGIILGLQPIRVLPSKKATLLMLAAYAHPFVLATVEVVRLARRETEHFDISYDAGTEMQIQPSDSRSWMSLECDAPRIVERRADAALVATVQPWPLRTQAGQPPRDADWINLAFAGTESAVRAAFAAARWTTADVNSLRSDVRTFLAVARKEGYRTGPVSLLTLGGVAPALVFQKQNNTFAKRHHIRIWRTARSVEGQAVWVAAATHDTGIEFSEAQRRFTHRIEGDIDLERATILADLTLAGAVPEFAMIERAAVARASVNAAGDEVTTDGRLALLFLRRLEPREAIR